MAALSICNGTFGVSDNDAFLDRIEESFKKTFLTGELEHNALQTLRVNPLDEAD